MSNFQLPSKTKLTLILAGVILVVSVIGPYFVYPQYGQTQYYLNRAPVEDAAALNESAIIAYEDLSPAGQASFDNPVPNTSAPLYSDRDRDTIQQLDEDTYIESNGQLYQIYIEHHDGVWVFVSLLQYAGYGVGGVLGLSGIIHYYLHRRRGR